MIVQAADKNNNRINRRMMGRFRRFISEMELGEAVLQGRKYTWSNEQRNPTLSKIDRWFFSADWEAAHPSCQLQAQSTSLSDHCPIMMATNVNFHSHR